MIKKQARAFTIMEVTIAMLISAIVIGITYTVYSIISRSYNSFNTKNEEMAVVIRLDELLQKDFDRSECISKDTAGITFQTANNNLVKYKFDRDYVLRIGLITDTFNVNPDTVNTFFETNAVDEIGERAEKNRVDELNLTLTSQNGKITYHYLKVYSSENLFNRKPDALH